MKCNRCIEKNIPCSEGTRKERLQKSSSRPSPLPPSEALVAADTGTSDELLKQWYVRRKKAPQVLVHTINPGLDLLGFFSRVIIR
jgi:hypothetical protein